MPKLLCACGNIINLSEIPCKDGFYVISEVNYDKLDDPIDLEVLLSKMDSVIKCSICERLYPLKLDNAESVTVYVKEIHLKHKE